MTYTPDPAEEITYSCGHTEIHGGNLADPTAQYAEAAGLKTYRQDEGLCITCKEPEKHKNILEWAPKK